jgi:hypothetical protein
MSTELCGQWAVCDCLAYHRAVFHTSAATRTQIHFDAAGAFSYLDFKIARNAINRLQISISNQFNIQMPADLDQYRGDNSHGAVVGRKRLVELRHDPANGWGFFKKIHIIA